MSPAAPQVQDLNTLINQYTTALAPQKTALDSQITTNDASGQQQTAGLDAAKTSAFGDIIQGSNDRGGYFSGFTPDQEAKYTGATYLPALAQLQSTIAGTRSSLLGKEADLQAGANTSALGEQTAEQQNLEKYNEDQAAQAAAAAAIEKQNEFTANQNSLDRAASATATNTKANTPTPAQQQATDFQAANGYLSGKVGGDGKVSPGTWKAAEQSWVNAGYSAASFKSNFGNYINTTHAQDYT